MALEPAHTDSTELSVNFKNFVRCLMSYQSVSQVSQSVVSDSLRPHELPTCQASLSITNSQSLLKLISIESVIPSNHLILCRPLLLLPSIFPSIRVFSNESALHLRWPKDQSFTSSISPSVNRSWCMILLLYCWSWFASILLRIFTLCSSVMLACNLCVISLFAFSIRVIMAPQMSLEMLLPVQIFWDSFRKTGVSSSLSVW